MLTRKFGAALAVGCTVVAKPASETPLSALALCELGKRAGVPKGVVGVVTSHSYTKDIGKHLCESLDVSGISFTGSTAVGKTLLRQGADTVKKVSLELGGNAAFIVFEDADIDKAVDGKVKTFPSVFFVRFYSQLLTRRGGVSFYLVSRCPGKV